MGIMIDIYQALTRHVLNLRSSSARSKLRPMKTSRLMRFSSFPQGFPTPSALEPKLSNMCTPWKKYLQARCIKLIREQLYCQALSGTGRSSGPEKVGPGTSRQLTLYFLRSSLPHMLRQHVHTCKDVPANSHAELNLQVWCRLPFQPGGYTLQRQ